MATTDFTNISSTGEIISFTFTVPIEGWDSNVQFLAAVPMNYTQTKFLSSNVTADGDVSDLQFNNLVVDKWYELNGQAVITTAASSDNLRIEMRDASSGGGNAYMQNNVGVANGENRTKNISVKFKASSTTLYSLL